MSSRYWTRVLGTAATAPNAQRHRGLANMHPYWWVRNFGHPRIRGCSRRPSLPCSNAQHDGNRTELQSCLVGGVQEVRGLPIHSAKPRCTTATFWLGPHSISSCMANICWKSQSLSSKLTVFHKPPKSSFRPFRVPSRQACTVTGQAAGMTVTVCRECTRF